MTNTIKGILDTEVIFVTGSNTTEAHPVIGANIRQAWLRGAKIIVADPRRIGLVDNAEIFLQIRPGTNIALYNGMLNIIMEEGLLAEDYIKERTENFDSIRDVIKEYPAEKVAEICGIDAGELRKAAIMFAKANTAAIFYSMGVTQFANGTHGVMSLSNLALGAGKVGKDSCGINPLRGQNNVQGTCDVGVLTTVYPGYQQVANPDAKAKFEKAWGVENLSPTPGFTLTNMSDHFGEEIKVAYFMGENLLLADADVFMRREQLKKLDFLIVQDIFLTETAELADVVLPAAGFAEKDGTITNTERRVQRVRKAIEPPGSAKVDWEIISEISKRLGYVNKFSSPRQVFDEIASVTPQYGGMDYDRLEDINGLHWPCPTKDHPGTPVLHKAQFSRAGGKATFMQIHHTEPKEHPDHEYPLTLTTGRLLYHFHTRTLSGKVEGLNKKSGRSIIEINPADAQALGIVDGERIRATSRRASIETHALVTDRVGKGVVFMPFHFADGPANALTNPERDPMSLIPELKICTCRLEKL